MSKKPNFSQIKKKAWKCNGCGHIYDYEPQECDFCEMHAENTRFFRNADKLVGAKITKIFRRCSTSSALTRDDIIAETDKKLTLYIWGINEENEEGV